MPIRRSKHSRINRCRIRRLCISRRGKSFRRLAECGKLVVGVKEYEREARRWKGNGTGIVGDVARNFSDVQVSFETTVNLEPITQSLWNK